MHENKHGDRDENPVYLPGMWKPNRLSFFPEPSYLHKPGLK